MIPPPEITTDLKRVVFNALSTIYCDPASIRPAWLLANLSDKVTAKYDIEPLLRSAMRLARNRCSGQQTTMLRIHTHADAGMLILQIDEQNHDAIKGSCLVTVSLGHILK